MDPYAGTGGTTGNLEQTREGWLALGGGTQGAAEGTEASYWGLAGEFVSGVTDKVLDSYSKSSVSDSVDKGLASAKTTTDKFATAANNWLGYASDPAKLESALTMVTVIVCVLGGVYVLALVAPVLRGVSK